MRQDKSDSQTKSPLPEASAAPTNGGGGDAAVRLAETRTLTDRERQRESALSRLGDQLLGEFRLLRRLGSGGMADVYLAEQTSLNRQVAIKVLRPDFVSDDSYRQRFEREAKAAAALSHPNIVQVYFIGEQAGIHYIAQEYVHGWNLRDFLKRTGPPSLAVSLHIIKQAALALQAASEAGIVHRDIKPENIMITHKGVVKVADFGLAQLSQAGDRVNLTQVGVTMGTPLYMSPEQVNGRKLDQRSDIYSLGVTCYHLLSGRPPFCGETALSVAVQHLNNTPEPLGTRRLDLPAAFCDIIHRMMAKDAEQRYPNAQAVLNDLQAVEQSWAGADIDAADLSLAAIVSSGEARTEFVRRSAGRNGRTRKLAWYSVALVVVASVAAAVGWLFRTDPLRSPVPAETRIPRKASVTEQYFLAISLVDNEDAWKAVGEYFPHADLEKRRSQEQLAMLYLRNRRLNEAEQLFDKFVALGGDEGLQAKGYAGKAVIACLKGDHQESQRIITLQLEPLRRRLDGEMLELLHETETRNRAVMEQKVEKGLDVLFSDDTGPPSEDTARGEK